NELGGLADESVDVAAPAPGDRPDWVTWGAGLGGAGVFVPFFARSELRGEANVDRAVAAFRSLCPLAGEGGVTLCYEGTLPADEIALLAAHVGSNYFGCYFDLANALAKRGLDPPAEI